MADWMLPNSSTQSLFSSMLGENMASNAVSESLCDGESGFTFHGSHEYHASTDVNYRNGPQDHHTDHVDDQTSRSWAMCEQQQNGGGGDLLERMVSRAGFDVPLILNTDTIKSADFPHNWEAYLTIPSGLSPTTFLESPIFASDSLYNKTFNLDGLSSESADKNNESFFGSMDASPFAFRPTPDSGPGPDPNRFFASSDNMAPFSSIEVSVESENAFAHQTSEHSKGVTITRKDDGGGNMSEQRAIQTVTSAEAEQFPSLLVDEQQIQEDDVADPRGAGYVIAPGEDGYNWRKYGQKQAKGSDTLQGYYKCSHSHCLVKKKVEFSQEGHITEIIYKGSHNHPKPSPAHRSLSHIPPEEISSAAMLSADYSNGPTTSLPVQNSSQFESGNVADRSLTFSNDEDDDERGTHGCVSVACDGDGDESESKKRKADMSLNGSTRAVKDPRVVVQTTSDVDILDDGYRWRKYGQKVVKGNPNPRSYYKCTSTGCAVRKHVERASHDLNSVITTYEGKHNHDIPAARNNNTQASSDGPNNNVSGQHRPEHSQQLHNNSMSQFQRGTSFGSFGLPTGPHLIPPQDHIGFGMNQHSMPNMSLGAWGVNQAGQYMGQTRTMNEMVMPKGEPKVEPMCDSGLSLPNASAVYQQVMSRMPLGPQI